VLEIADGVIQRETVMMLDVLAERRHVDYMFLAVSDALAGPACLDFVNRRWDFNVVALSGLVTRSPLCVREIEGLTSAPCVDTKELAEPSVEKMLMLSLADRCLD
jgi:hypothetical protein